MAHQPAVDVLGSRIHASSLTFPDQPISSELSMDTDCIHTCVKELGVLTFSSGQRSS